jgi:ankyrin repeat protein
MDFGFGINLGPQRRPPVAIGIDPRSSERLIIRQRSSTGCLVFALLIIAGVAYLAAEVLTVKSPTLPVTVLTVVAAIAASIAFGRSWTLLDRQHQLLQSGFGILFPLFHHRCPLAGFKWVVVRQKCEHTTDSDGASSVTTTYQVSLEGDDSEVLLTAGVWEAAMEVAEVVAHFLRIGIDDQHLGVKRRYQELDLVLSQKTDATLERTGIQMLKPAPGRYTVLRSHDGALEIDIPRPRDHSLLAVTLLVFVLWTLPVALMGSLWIGLLPPAIMLASWIKVAWGYRSHVVADKHCLTVTAWGLIGRRTVKIPYNELEDLVVLDPDRGGPREVLAFVFDGFLVARSDRSSVRFGHGLSANELERLRLHLAAHIYRQHSRFATSSARSFVIPRLRRWVAAPLGLATGAVLAHLTSGPLAACIAAPFLEHLGNVAGGIGLVSGSLLDLRQRHRGFPTALAIVVLGVLALVVAVASYLGPPVFQAAPSFNELSLLADPQQRPGLLYWIGFVPTLLLIATAAATLLTLVLQLGPRVLSSAAGLLRRAISSAWRQRQQVAAALALLSVLLLVLALVIGYLSRDRLLFLLVKEGQTGLATRLLAADPELVSCHDSSGRTALHYAASSGRHELAGTLLAQGADIAAQDRWQATPLHRALWHVEVARLLVDAGAPLETADARGATPLLVASGSADAEVLRLLLDSGAQVSTQDNQGNTPLHMSSNDDDTTSLLIAAGAPVNATSAGGKTPLMQAAHTGSASVIKIMVMNGASVNALDKHGKTAMHWLTWRRCSEAVRIAEVLLSLGAQPDGVNSDGATPAEMAQQQSCTELSELLSGHLAHPPTTVQTPLEAMPQPLEAVPYAKAVSVRAREHDGFVTYQFGPPLASAELLDLSVAEDGTVWIGSDLGLIRFREGARAIVYGLDAEIPGLRVDTVAVCQGRIFVDLAEPTGPGTSRAVGVHTLEPEQLQWRQVFDGGVWNLVCEEQALWCPLFSGQGLRWVDTGTGELIDYTAHGAGLLHPAVASVTVTGDQVWCAMFGDYSEQAPDRFVGGGVSVLDRRLGTWTSYTIVDGLARAYCCDITADENEVWVAHWQEEAGLSVKQSHSSAFEAVTTSVEGIQLGGPVLQLDGEWLWIGQQGGLVRYNRQTRQATSFAQQHGLPGYIVSAVEVADRCVWVTAYSAGEEGKCGLVRFPRSPS